MALKKTFTHAGLTITDGYLRIHEIHGNKNRIKLKLSYQAGAGKPALFVKDFWFTPDLSKTNFIKQGYEYLKTITEDFSGATDV